MHTKKLRILTSLALGALALGACEMKGTPPEDVPVYTPEPTTPYTPPAPTPTDRKFVILHTNDEHSHIMGFGPESEYPFLPKLTVDSGTGKHVFDGPATVGAWVAALMSQADQQTVGGMVRRQYLVNKIRAESADPVLLVSAGDSMMGTVMHVAAPTAAPDQVLMALLGYDFMTIGNHDFDWGPEAFASTIKAARDTTFGASVPYLSSNIDFSQVTAPSDSGYALKAEHSDQGDSGAPIEPWATKTLANGLKIGFFGLLGIEADMVAVSRGKVAFSPDFAALVATAKDTIKTLRNDEKVDVVVLLSHLGYTEEKELIQQAPGIDVVVGGHSHTELPPETIGNTIIAQAGSYGRFLGQMTIVVHPDGTIALDAAGSKLNPIDWHLDSEIYGDTDFTKSPPVESEGFANALSLTGGIIGPVAAGLTDGLSPFLSAFVPAGGLWDPMVVSDHSIEGPPRTNQSADSSLSHLSTDASYAVAAHLACLSPTNLVAVQANGVLRDNLLVGQPKAMPGSMDPDPTNGTDSASFADMFRVDPLGASPFEASGKAAPGFPLVAFKLNPLQLMGGLEVGVTQGLTNSDFFLSFTGAEVTYSTDPNLENYNAAKLAENQPAGGHILTLKLGGTLVYDVSRAPNPTNAAEWLSRWSGFTNPATEDPADAANLITVVTNLYIAGFLDTFGLVPIADAYGNPVSGTTQGARLAQLVLCQNPMVTADCTAATPVPSVGACYALDAAAGDTTGAPPWVFPEQKEWQALMSYTSFMVPQRDLSPMYTGAEPARVSEAP